MSNSHLSNEEWFLVEQCVGGLKELLSRVHEKTEVGIDSMPAFFNIIMKDEDELAQKHNFPFLISDMLWLNERELLSLDEDHDTFIQEYMSGCDNLSHLLLTALIKYREIETGNDEFRNAFIVNLYKRKDSYDEFDHVTVLIDYPMIINGELVFKQPKVINTEFRSNDDMVD